jgi:threonine/homoserine/homoserine lactone efflux protein
VFDAATRSLAQGRRAGLTSMLGVLSGGVRA